MKLYRMVVPGNTMRPLKKILMIPLISAIPFAVIVYNNFIYYRRGWHSMLIQYHTFFWLARLFVSPILVLIIIQAWKKIDQLYKLFLYPVTIFFIYNFLCWFISFISCRWLAAAFDGRNRNLYNTIIYESTLLNLVVCIITFLLIFGWLYYEKDRILKQETLYLGTSLKEAKSELTKIQNRITNDPDTQRAENIAVRNGHRTTLIPVEEITYIRSKGAYINIVTGTGSYLLKRPISEIEKTLPASFLRVHRSSIVNMKFVREFRSLLNGDGYLLLKDAKEIRLSRTYREHVTNILSSL